MFRADLMLLSFCPLSGLMSCWVQKKTNKVGADACKKKKEKKDTGYENIMRTPKTTLVRLVLVIFVPGCLLAGHFDNCLYTSSRP
jgi:hypothetical protein